MTVLLLLFTGTNPGGERNRINILIFNYQRLSRQDNETTLGWSSINICNEEFELQGFIIENNEAMASGHVIQAGSSNTGQILTSQLSTESGNDILYYRLVAVSDNRTICSDLISQETFYRFEGAM